MKSITAILSCALALVLGAAHLSANWVVVDRFDDPELPGWFVLIPNVDNPDRVDPNNPPYIKAVADPFGGPGNALEVFPGVLINQTVNMFASLLIPEEARIFDPFPDDGLATMYVRVGRPMAGDRPGEIDSGWGLVGFFIDEMGNPRLDDEGNPVRPTTWGHFSVMSRFEPDGTLDVRDEGVPAPFVKRTGSLTTNEWYELWYVINHPENSFRVYIRGGPEFPGPDPVLLYGVEATDRDAEYRTKTFEDLAFFFIGTSTGSVTGGARGIDPYYLSEIHIDPTGMNLTRPPGVGEGDPTPTNPFDALVLDAWSYVPNVGFNYGFQNGPGWSYHMHLGALYSSGFPWLYHHPRGWMFYHSGNYDAEGMLLYSVELGWIFTAASVSGWLFIIDSGEWVAP